MTGQADVGAALDEVVATIDWRNEVEIDLEILETINCQFWACEGPDEQPELMKTCQVCWRIHELRTALRGGAT